METAPSPLSQGLDDRPPLISRSGSGTEREMSKTNTKPTRLQLLGSVRSKTANSPRLLSPLELSLRATDNVQPVDSPAQDGPDIKKINKNINTEMIMLMYKTNRQVLRFGSTIVVWVNVVRRIRVFRSKGKNVVSRLVSLSYNITGSINLSLPIPHI